MDRVAAVYGLTSAFGCNRFIFQVSFDFGLAMVCLTAYSSYLGLFLKQDRTPIQDTKIAQDTKRRKGRLRDRSLFVAGLHRRENSSVCKMFGQTKSDYGKNKPNSQTYKREEKRNNKI